MPTTSAQSAPKSLSGRQQTVQGVHSVQTWPISAVFFGPRLALNPGERGLPEPDPPEVVQFFIFLGRLGHTWALATLAASHVETSL